MQELRDALEAHHLRNACDQSCDWLHGAARKLLDATETAAPSLGVQTYISELEATIARLSGRPFTVQSLTDAIPLAGELKDGEQWARLSVNVGTEPAAALRRWMDANSITATEAVRRAISVWDFYERSAIDGKHLALIGEDGVMRTVYVDHKDGGTKPNPAPPQTDVPAAAADQTGGRDATHNGKTL